MVFIHSCQASTAPDTGTSFGLGIAGMEFVAVRDISNKI
jgi:hypothetical protein